MVLLLLNGLARSGVADPPTVEQVNQALDIAELAAQHDLTKLSMEAISRALRYGTPTVSTAAARVPMVHSGARVNTSLPVPSSAIEQIHERIPATIFRLSKQWNNTAEPVDVYRALKEVVLPPKRPREAVFYNMPMKVNPLQPDRMPPTKSVAQELIFWAAKADKLEELRDDLEQALLQDSAEAKLLALLCAIELQDGNDLNLRTDDIQKMFHAGMNRQTAEMMAFAGAAIQQSGKHPDVAATLLRLAGLALFNDDSTAPRGPTADSPTRAVLLAAARSQFAVNKQKTAVELLEIYLQNPNGSKSPEPATIQGNNKVETVARELHSRQMLVDARRILGDAHANIFEQRYRIRNSDGDAQMPVEQSETKGPQARLPEIIAGSDVKTQTDIADRIWVCRLDTVKQTSEILFVLPDCLNAGSPNVSPDGLHVAFDATFPGEAVTSDKKIYVAALDGTSIRTLGRGTMPSWSPAGKRIVCSRYSPESGVWILRADGTDARLIDSRGWSGQWSPDGQMIAYTKREAQHQDVAVYDLVEDRFFSVLAERDHLFSEVFGNFSWSPDSEQIVFKSDRGIAVTNVLKTRPIELIFHGDVPFAPNLAWRQAPFTIVFAPDYRRLEGERLHYISGKTSAPPAYVKGQMPDRRNSDATWMNNGRTLVYISKPQK